MSYLLRTSRAIRTSAFKTQTARFSIVPRRMAEGDTGAPRSGGATQSDSFSKREEASENLYIKQQEAEKLKALREKIRTSESQLAKDKKDAEEMERRK